jgi:hypothetical protein
MRHVATLVLVLVAAGLAGCEESSRRTDPERMADTIERRAHHLQTLTALYMSVGLAEVTTEPGGARLLVDDGEFLGDRSTIWLPWGAHEFTAVWPDGHTVTRRVFVESHVPEQMNVDYAEEVTGRGVTVKAASPGQDAKTTRIRLVREDK